VAKAAAVFCCFGRRPIIFRQKEKGKKEKGNVRSNNAPPFLFLLPFFLLTKKIPTPKA
jgi:hypothetical protein